ncbi:hypothetical protein L195_g055667, partial [Trifolium pratense]
EFSAEVPIDSVGTTKPEKGVEMSLTPFIENGTKPQLGIDGAAAIDSIRPESPDILYNQDSNSSSRNEVFWYIHLRVNKHAE